MQKNKETTPQPRTVTITVAKNTDLPHSVRTQYFYGPLQYILFYPFSTLKYPEGMVHLEYINILQLSTI